MGFRDREPPPEVVRQLKEIHPDADILWYGDRWWVGKWRFSREAARRATFNISNLARRPDTPEKWHMIRFMREVQRGFRPTHWYQTETFGSIVNDFRAREWRASRHFDKAFGESMDAQLVQPQGPENMRDIVHAEGRSIVRGFRGRFRRKSTIIVPRTVGGEP